MSEPARRPPLVLASASPRRRALLASLGLDFTVRPVDLDETPRDGEPAHDYVLRLAREKAAARVEDGELVLAADTVVVLEDGENGGERLLGKPADPAEARRMLAEIAGRGHTVLTGVALVGPRGGDGNGGDGNGEHGGGDRGEVSDVASTRVEMAPIDEDEIAWYVATGEPLDKAGSYAIQDLGAMYVERIEGNYTNVVGLPLPLVKRLFGEMGWGLREFRPG
ncbi:MAG TPA: Maf family protein [Thermoanaerobaculia bacterium]|nr:Maf family protein [Thermoanaerobaculia bacterium]